MPSHHPQLRRVVVILVVAFVARVLPVVRGGGMVGLSFYDDAVHFAAAVGLVHGRLPYRDFLLLHPPGIVVFLAPFALLSRLTSDPTGLVVARLAFMLLGAVNAVLVSQFLRPVGVFAAWCGGLFYAVFFPAVYSEHTVLLESLGNTCLLLALLLLSPLTPRVRPAAGRLVLAGALLGYAAATKIWGVLPVVILFAWLAFRWGVRPAARFFVGAAAACTVVCLPFFVWAPASMWRMVVLDQLQRNETQTPVTERLQDITGLSLYRLADGWTPMLVIAVVVVLAAVAGAWTVPRCRPAVLLLLGLTVLLLTTPSWFPHYSALTAAVLAITVGAAGQRLVRLPPRPAGQPAVTLLSTGLTAALIAGLCLYAVPVLTDRQGQRFPGPALSTVVAGRPGCVTSDHPGALVLMNVLSRNLNRHCRLVVDLGGASYHLSSPARGVVNRRQNTIFQAYALRYLRRGDTVILARFHHGFGLSNRSLRVVYGWPVLAQADGYGLRTPHRRAPRTAR